MFLSADFVSYVQLSDGIIALFHVCALWGLNREYVRSDVVIDVVTDRKLPLVDTQALPYALGIDLYTLCGTGIPIHIAFKIRTRPCIFISN